MEKNDVTFSLIERDQNYLNLDEDESPLNGYKTNDTFYHKMEVKKAKVNTKVLGIGLCALVFFSGIIAAVLWGTDNGYQTTFVPFDHSRVRIAPKSTTLCNLSRNCSAECTTIVVEHLLGCCTVRNNL